MARPRKEVSFNLPQTDVQAICDEFATDRHSKRKIGLLLVSEAGYDHHDAGKAVQSDPETVLRWVTNYDQVGLNGFYQRRRQELPKQARQRIEGAFSWPPSVFGFSESSYSTDMFIELLWSADGQDYTADAVEEALTDMGFVKDADGFWSA